jgi:hypothetical protein
LTGYELDATPIAPDDERLAPIIAACAETGTLALVGAPVPGPGIGVLAMNGGGARVVYARCTCMATRPTASCLANPR